MVPDNSVTTIPYPYGHTHIYRYNTDTSTVLYFKSLTKLPIKLQLDHSNNNHQLTATNFSKYKSSGSSEKYFYDAKYMHLHRTKFVT